jgi:CubicO group peptidase (beta-lactamase class C family)
MTMNIASKSLLIGIVCLVLAACSKRQNSDDFFLTFNDDFKEELAGLKVSNASYAVFSHDTIILRDSFSATGTGTSGDSPFLIGSVTKVFTAVAVMQLLEKGKVDLDKPVAEYVHDFQIRQRFPASAPVTLRAVLTHHAGLPSDNYLHKFSKTPNDFNDLLDYLNTQYTCYPSGQIWAYSNLGYALLGIVVERVSGMKYEEYILRNIFEPLGMNSSGFYFDYGSQKHLSAAFDENGNPKTELPIYDKPAGAIYSTANDMIRFGRSFIDGKELLLKNNTLEQMFELQNRDNLLDLDHRSAICFNYKNKAYELGRLLEHGGATMFHRAQLVIAPDAGLVSVLLSDSPKGKDNAWKLDEQLMVEYCKATGISPDRTRNLEKSMQFTPISRKNLESYAGIYAMPGLVCRFDWKNNHLSPTINGQNFYLVPHDSNSFVPAKRFLGMMFRSKKMFFLLEEICGEKHFIQAMPWGGLNIIGTQTVPEPIPEVWNNRVGDYAVTNAVSEDAATIERMKISIEDGFIVLRYGFNPEISFGQDASIALDIVNNNEAFVLGYGRGGGESVVFEPDGSSFRFMGLKFYKIPDGQEQS